MRSVVLTLVVASLTSMSPNQTSADERLPKEKGLQCYTGDMLADLRTHAKTGGLKALPMELKNLIAHEDTVAVLVDSRYDDKVVVQYVKRSSSKVFEQGTYPSGTDTYKLFAPPDRPVLKDK